MPTTLESRGMPVVLLVDDQPFIGIAVKGLLAGDRDIELHICQDPRDAPEVAARVRPSVALIDLVMPEIDGLTLIRTFRANPATSSVALIAMSGNADERSRQAALASGASEFIVKLPAKQELLDLVHRHAAAGGPQAPVADSQRTRSAAPAVPAAIRREELTLDADVLAGLRHDSAGSGPAFVTSLIDLFVGEAEALLDQLRAAVSAADLEAMRNIAHRLAGSSQTIGARRLAALSGQLEDHALRNRGGAVGRVLLAEITRELAQVRSALDRERSRGGGE
jgi:CheY-like chemotaxis protein